MSLVIKDTREQFSVPASNGEECFYARSGHKNEHTCSSNLLTG